MNVSLLPLFSQLNPGPGLCPLGCQTTCQIRTSAPDLSPPPGHQCPLYFHQAQTCAQIQAGVADIYFNKSATGGGKSLGASLPCLIDPNRRMMGCYPTIELVEDQTDQQTHYHRLFGLNATQRLERLFGEELNRRVAGGSNKFKELLISIYHKPVLLTNPDIFHLIIHHQYRDPAYGSDELPLALAEFPDYWVFDEFHIFDPHQEAALLNSLALIRRTQQQTKRFLFTSATSKPEWINLLRQAGFTVAEIEGDSRSEDTPGFRQILQGIQLEFIELKDSNTETWLTENLATIRDRLQAETRGRGLIILNSVALAGRITRRLQALLPQVLVREISGRIDRRQRAQLQSELKEANQPVLVVGTSAVDVGVDFKIHLLIFESSDAATVIQRLGRLGRHPGFSHYQAFILISGKTPWIMARLAENLRPEEPITRSAFQEMIADAFDPPREFQEYRQRWGALQAQGILSKIRESNAQVSQGVRDRMVEDLQRIYGEKLKPKCETWFAVGHNEAGKQTQKELLRFRGGSTLQAAVWDEQRFYTYDFLRLIPYANVAVCDRSTFLEAASQAGYGEESFPDAHINVYLQIQEWVDERFDLSLNCNCLSSELKTGELTLLNRIILAGHPQTEVSNCLKQKKILAFLVPVNRQNLSSHWEINYSLHLSPLFGLYRLTDGAGQAYACAFNQDALLLEALKWRLKKFFRTQSQSIIF